MWIKFVVGGMCVVSDKPLALSKPWFPFLDNEDFESHRLCGSFCFFVRLCGLVSWLIEIMTRV